MQEVLSLSADRIVVHMNVLRAYFDELRTSQTTCCWFRDTRTLIPDTRHTARRPWNYICNLMMLHKKDIRRSNELEQMHS